MNRKRRRVPNWLRFSLSSFLLLLTVFTVWFGTIANQSRKRQRAVAAVKELGGVIHFDYQIDASGKYDEKATPPGANWIRNTIGDDFFRKVIVLDFAYGSRFPKGKSMIDDDDLALVGNLPDIKTLEVGRNAITDDGLIHFNNLSKLETLYLYRTRVHGQGLRNLANCRNLTSLSLANTPLNDDGLEHIGQLKQLEWLQLNCTQVSDKGVAALANLTNLKSLSLSATDITDDALKHLTGLYKLKKLGLSGTHVTTEGVATLQLKLPKCGISTSFGLGKSATQVELWQDGYIPSKDELLKACKQIGLRASSDSDKPASPITSLRLHDSLVAGETVIQVLQHSPQVNFVSFNRVLFGDSVVDELKHLNALNCVYLRNCPLTDSGVKSFQDLENLRELDIHGTRVTDDCIEDLLRLTTLQMLRVGNTRLTVDGIQRLHQGLPNCQISW